MNSVSPEELYLYCKIDDVEEQQRLADSIAEAKEAYLLRQNIPLNESTRERFALCVKAMTLHELDHPGEATPQGIREKINDLKFNH